MLQASTLTRFSEHENEHDILIQTFDKIDHA